LCANKKKTGADRRYPSGWLLFIAFFTRSYYFSIKWLTPFYPAKDSQAAGGGEKCMDLRFLRLRRWLLKQQPNKTVFNRFIEN